jgi:fructose-specific component phosphotransferase system IIB-like protein
VSQLPEYPRLLFSIRISEDIKPGDLSTELLADWLSTLPVEAKSVRVEAGFASDSTLLIVSMPIAMLGYLPYDPAITLIGAARSNNQISVENKVTEAEVRILHTFSFKSMIKFGGLYVADIKKALIHPEGASSLFYATDTIRT